MTNLSETIKFLPPMKSGKKLMSALEVLPEYDAAICDADAPVRLMALSDLYRVYVPNQMSLEIYSKLYLALMRSLQKKGTKLAVQQQNQNFKAIMQQGYSGIMGGSDSFTIIGASGIGKSSAISRAITLVTENRIIEVDSVNANIKRQSFCTRLRLILSMMYSRERGLSPSFFNRSKGISLVVAWTLPLTLLHQARACPFKSARELYLIPTMKLSRTN